MYARRLSLIALALFILGLVLAWESEASAQQIVINEIEDIDFGRASPTGGRLRADMRFCVATDQPVTYRVIATGFEPGGQFRIRSGPYRINYRVRYTDRRRDRGFRRLFPGQPLTGLRVRGNNNGVCQQQNAAIRVDLPAGQLRRAPSGVYQGVLMLTVSPE